MLDFGNSAFSILLLVSSDLTQTDIFADTKAYKAVEGNPVEI